MLSQMTTRKQKFSALIYLGVVLIIIVALTFAFRFLLQITFIKNFKAGIINVGNILMQVMIFALMVAVCITALVLERRQKSKETLQAQSGDAENKSAKIFSALGFKKSGIHKQILTGLILAAGLLFIVSVPSFFGVNFFFAVGQFSAAQITYEFLINLLVVGVAEEIVFRGYIFHKLGEIFSNKHIIILISSALFGIWHIINGSLIQVAATFFIGIAFGYARSIKCGSILSGIIAHGFYNSMLSVLGLVVFLLAS